jgi:AcrR family transcriptional regulator
MSVKRVKQKTGRPMKVPGEKSTKERIFDAAVDLFAEKGFNGVSIRDISRAVGITEGAVYKHYSGKDKILDSIFAYVENRIYPQAPAGSLDTMIESLSFREILESMPKFMMADPYMARIARIMVIEMYHNEKIRNYVRRELFERPAEETEIMFRKLMENGKIRPCDPGAMATLFISYLIYWYFETYIFGYGDPQDIERNASIAQSRISSFADMLEPEGSHNEQH